MQDLSIDLQVEASTVAESFPVSEHFTRDVHCTALSCPGTANVPVVIGACEYLSEPGRAWKAEK